ncbi:vacuolar iron transporter homolog 5-like, partial [Lolium rigidum]|uniref:vacuolar iron transporter homolog 5-like n=1 Tax=Lolium rigidum TaxID=89674 RepID=UPI001F5C56AB
FSTASLMPGVSAVKHDVRAVVVSRFAGLLAGACSMAIGEYVSVCSQRDVELAQLNRDGKRICEEERALPSPIQADVASALAFSVGVWVRGRVHRRVHRVVAGFIVGYRLWVAVVVAVATMALATIGYFGAVLGAVAAFHRTTLRVVSTKPRSARAWPGSGRRRGRGDGVCGVGRTLPARERGRERRGEPTCGAGERAAADGKATDGGRQHCCDGGTAWLHRRGRVCGGAGEGLGNFAAR